MCCLDEFVQEVIICKRKHSGSSKVEASDAFPRVDPLTSFKTKLVFQDVLLFLLLLLFL